MSLRVVDSTLARDAYLLMRHAHWLSIHRFVAHHLWRFAVMILVLSDRSLGRVQLWQLDVLLVVSICLLRKDLLGLLGAVTYLR